MPQKYEPFVRRCMLGEEKPLAVAAAQAVAAALGSHRRVVRWERFLPRRSLRVLLVEHDDSTRIVGVLLKKCSYHVTVGDRVASEESSDGVEGGGGGAGEGRCNGGG